MKFDSPVAQATLIKVASVLAELADEYEEEGDTYAREVIENCLGRITERTGGTNQGTLDQHVRAVNLLMDDKPPRL